MSRIDENPVVAQHHFTSFEVFSSVLSGYDLDMKQIDNGPFSASMKQVQYGPVTINRFTTTRRFEANGNPPPGVRTFGIPTAECQPFIWRGKKTSGNTIQIYRPSTELALITHPHFEAIDISIHEDDFNALNQRYGLPELDEMIGSREMVDCDPAIMYRLRKTLLYICESVDSNSDHFEQHTGLQNLIKYEIPYLLAQSLMSSEEHRVNVSAKKRSRALKTAIDYINTAWNEAASVHNLCQQTGINERTLQRAFLDQYDVTPKAYIKMHRLNEAYKALLHSDPLTTKVTDIALGQGFWHMSQFATDYRYHFGELPSETLRYRN